MRQALTVAVALVIVESLVSMVGVALPDGDVENESPAEVEPGERMSRVLGVRNAEIEGDIAERGFAIAVANDSNGNAHADVVTKGLADVEERIDELEDFW